MSGTGDSALTIRTFAATDVRIHLRVGDDVVRDSDPDEEVEDSWTKARPLPAAAGSRLPADVWTQR